jgi:mercuric ion transport protein
MSEVHADKWGPLGSIFAALCCLGAAPLLAGLSALGLAFVIHDAILIPLLIFFLGVTIWALPRNRSRCGTAGPLWLAWLAAVVTLGSLWISGVAVGLGLVLLVSASIWNAIATKRCEPTRGMIS